MRRAIALLVLLTLLGVWTACSSDENGNGNTNTSGNKAVAGNANSAAPAAGANTSPVRNTSPAPTPSLPYNVASNMSGDLKPAGNMSALSNNEGPGAVRSNRTGNR